MSGKMFMNYLKKSVADCLEFKSAVGWIGRTSGCPIIRRN